LLRRDPKYWDPAAGFRAFHKRLILLENAVNQLISPEKIRKQLFERVDLLTRLYRAIKPDKSIYRFTS
jgi:hypothetical protein